MVNLEYLFSPLRHAQRTGDVSALTLALSKILKKADDALTPDATKAEIRFEAAKCYRLIGNAAEATALAENTIANIPVGVLETFAALKRLRVLLHLDADEIIAARELLAEIDGDEVTMQHGRRQIYRHDDKITTETWLLSVEAALTEGDLAEAAGCLENAVRRFAFDKAQLSSRRRYGFHEQRRIDQYLSDTALLLDLSAAACEIRSGHFDDDPAGKLMSLRRNILDAQSQNPLAANVSLLAKISCLLNEWNPSVAQPAGINLSEARRWTMFGKPFVGQPPATVQTNANSVAIISVEPFPANGFVPGAAAATAADTAASFQARSFASSGEIQAYADLAARTAAATMEQAVKLFEQKTQSPPVSPASEMNHLFGGYAQYFDLQACLFNCTNNELTGYVKFDWKPDHYESEILRGCLPPFVKNGAACLYVVNGAVVDAVFDGIQPPNDAAEARINFRLLVQMCYSIGLQSAVKIMSRAYQAPEVSERLPLLCLRHDDLLAFFGELDEEFNKDAAIADLSEAAETDGNARAGVLPSGASNPFSFANMDEDLPEDGSDELSSSSGINEHQPAIANAEENAASCTAAAVPVPPASFPFDSFDGEGDFLDL